MTKPKLTFDSRIPEEAALLERLNCLPEERHIEYIRNLAVTGFLQERAERSQARPGPTMPRAGIPGPAPPDGHLNSPESQSAACKPAAQPESVESPADLTLASLRQLVG